jgi:hypothetical protein
MLNHAACQSGLTYMNEMSRNLSFIFLPATYQKWIQSIYKTSLHQPVKPFIPLSISILGQTPDPICPIYLLNDVFFTYYADQYERHYRL